MLQIVPGDAGSRSQIEAPTAARWRRIAVTNDSPNQVYLRLGYGVTAQDADYVLRPRRGLSRPIDPTAAVTVLVDPTSTAVGNALWRVSVFLDDCLAGTQAADWDLASVLDYPHSVNGNYAATAADTVLTFDTLSMAVQVWNRDATAALYVNFTQPSTKANPDLELLAGEFWHGAVAARSLHYQGGAAQFAVWS